MSLEAMQNRLRFMGGSRQQDRMILDKARSLDAASKYSYQAAHFLSWPEGDEFNGVMNPVTHNMDYDTKMISTSNPKIKVGDVFYWTEGKSHWICYAQDTTELAYFRGECRKCNYSLQWVDKNKELQEAFIAVVGPTQVNADTLNVSGAVIDVPNADLVVLVTDNERNTLYFNQQQTFVLRGFTYRIKQMNNLSMPGVIKLNCERISSNRIEDDIENDVSNVWNVQPVIEHYLIEDVIVGNNPIKPLFTYYFDAAVAQDKQGYWTIEDWNGTLKANERPFEIITDTSDTRHCSITWTSKWEGNFTLCYYYEEELLGKRYIVVESLI